MYVKMAGTVMGVMYTTHTEKTEGLNHSYHCDFFYHPLCRHFCCKQATNNHIFLKRRIAYHGSNSFNNFGQYCNESLVHAE